MSQYASTVVIQVSNSRLWETLGNISVKGFNLAKLKRWEKDAIEIART